MTTTTNRPNRTNRLRARLAALAGTGVLAATLLGAAPAHAEAVVPDGLYYLTIPGDPALALGKTTSCEDGAGGTFDFREIDATNFRQKFFLIRQPSGSYLVASECQPTVFMTIDPVTSGVSFEYDTAGRIGRLGDWDPRYAYNQAHTADQEWQLLPAGDGSVTVTSPTTGSHFLPLRLVPTR